MRITKDYLKKVIKEELQKLTEGFKTGGEGIADKSLLVGSMKKGSKSLINLSKSPYNHGILNNYGGFLNWYPLDDMQYNNMQKELNSSGGNTRAVLEKYILPNKDKKVSMDEEDFIFPNQIHLS